jgi:general secretion pathway protein E
MSAKAAFTDRSVGDDLTALAGRVLPPGAETGVKTFRDLWTRSGLDADAFADHVADLLSVERVSFDRLKQAESLAEHFSARFLREFGAYPFRAPDGSPAIAVAEPPPPELASAAGMVLGKPARVQVASYEDLSSLLAGGLGESASAEALASGVAEDDVESLRDLASGAPVVRALNDLFERAAESRATDLHIEPMRDSLSVRLRVDGILRPVPAPPPTLAAALLSRVKILAGLNIAERRLPQDGSARLKIQGSVIDVRVAIMPSARGEAAVIRFLPRDRGLLDVGRLGMRPALEQAFRRLLAMPNGMIIITGPTGSGKTTTLAAALTSLNETSRKILTVEDPIEYELPGIVQTQVAPGVGLTFASALRAFLRLDPNVIMVGEVRDAETAGIAVQAALTGHLVLTTLHTETAAAAVPRLIDLEVEDFLLQSTLRGIVAQRLVRLLCPHCKSSRRIDPAMLARDPRHSLLGLRSGDLVCEPVGCERCGGSGYRGRSGVFEILEVDSDLRTHMRRGTAGPTIEAAARRAGFRAMIDDAAELCREGLTSPAEVLRVTAMR